MADTLPNYFLMAEVLHQLRFLNQDFFCMSEVVQLQGSFLFVGSGGGNFGGILKIICFNFEGDKADGHTKLILTIWVDCFILHNFDVFEVVVSF